METIDINKLEFFSGTYNTFRVAKYGTFIRKNGKRVANEHTIELYQGSDDIMFVYIYSKHWINNFIMEGMTYTYGTLKHITAIVGKHNGMARNKKINALLKQS